MELLTLIATAALIPGVSFDGIGILGDGMVVAETTVGTGRVASPGRVATVEFIVEVIGGKELYNTYRRGLPYTVHVGERADPVMERLVWGMREGGVRDGYLPESVVSSIDSTGLLPRGDLFVRLRLTETK